ncbi:MAG: hypothetical protein E6K81_13150 [Candidatus Eisenbacteria bacterium]|uniref:Tetratricopeptide repeat protein n=1 Tax=Eiseniibacteriota bacterium TaxID=2212470 RepID=A0A538U2V6_UNCEI|nr:MAG: hypothetical protein E6K81_13150 [Candidatus Eisenbacteria bacterium]
MLLPVSARGQDGGSRSVFAEGVGNRAVAMGGAFSALSDDASGLLWNPGGLGRVQRLQFEAGQSSYFGPGTGESYLLAAMPNWRWGVIGLSLRHYGVQDIDQRDDRNFVVAGPTSDSQTEVTLGYGRGLGSFLSLGGALRARHQSLAGYSASGFGVDLGITGQPWLALGRDEPWAEDVTWGFALANVVRPSMRLDRETVPDPTTLRTGFAWHHMIGAVRTLVVAADLERAAGMGARLHAGAELGIIPEFTLRAGLDGRAMTAGTGFHWRDLSFDYTYEARALDAVHRVGLCYALGRTVGETRAAAEQGEERRLEVRMTDLFQRRQSDQIDSLLARSEDRRAAGDFDGALELLGTVAALDPGRPGIAAKQAAGQREQGLALERAGDFPAAIVAFGGALSLAPDDSAAAAGSARCRAESDARALRSATTRQMFAAALDAFGGDRLPAARDGFQRILGLVPEDQDASTMLRRTNEAIAKRVAGLLRETARSLEGGRTDEATELLDQATALDPQAAGLVAARGAVSRAQAATPAGRAAAAAKPAPRAAAGPALSTKELELLYRRGMTAMQQGRSDDALRFWEIVWSSDPRYAQVSDYLKREYLTRGMEAFARGQLDEASAFWRRALAVDPTDAKAAGYLERAQKQKSRTRQILGSN